MRVRLSDSTRLSEFIGFLAVPHLTLSRLENDEIEIRPSPEAEEERIELLVDLMLQGWNAAHTDSAARIVDTST